MSITNQWQSDNLLSKLKALEQQHLLRQRRIIDSRHQHFITKQKTLIDFASNDYLGLANDERVKTAFIESVRQCGVGSTASAMVCGYSRVHHDLEMEFADFLGRERALLFNSGYHANLGVVTTLADRHTSIVADKECHASLIDAVTLSRARHYRFPNQNFQLASSLLGKHKATMLISESIFSMIGEVTRADQLSNIAKNHHALLLLDDAHGFGILGKHGKGICEHFNLHANEVPLLVTTLGKSIGAMGAVVTGNNNIIEYILQKARTYCYSTALPPAVCAAALAALRIFRSEPWRTSHLQSLIQHFHAACKDHQISLINLDCSAIKCIAVQSNEQALILQKHCESAGFSIAAIRPPTVSTPRIRIVIHVNHTKHDITRLIAVIAETFSHEKD